MRLMRALVLCTLAVLGALSTSPAGAHGLRAGQRAADRLDGELAAAVTRNARMDAMHAHIVAAVGDAAAAELEAGEGEGRRLLHRGCHWWWCMPFCNRCSRGGHCRKRGKVFRCNRDEDEDEDDGETPQGAEHEEDAYGEVTSACGVPFEDLQDLDDEDEIEFPDDCDDDDDEPGDDDPDDDDAYYDNYYWQIELED